MAKASLSDKWLMGASEGSAQWIHTKQEDTVPVDRREGLMTPLTWAFHKNIMVEPRLSEATACVSPQH